MSAEHLESGPSPVGIDKRQLDRLLKTGPDELVGTVYSDLLSNEPKNEQSRNIFRQLLRDKLELNLPDAVERIWQLPPVILRRSNDEYIRLLVEARDLYIAGHFYSCVAMCGIVGEKLLKELMRNSILIASEGGAQRPSEEAFDQLERVDASAMMRFLNRAQLLSNDGEKAARKLGELRNDYAHARGKNSQADALESIRKLHALLEETVSVLKDYEIVEGKFVRSTR